MGSTLTSVDEPRGGDELRLVADRFTLADLVVGALLVWAHRSRLLADLPHARAAVDRITARPALQRAMTY